MRFQWIGGPSFLLELGSFTVLGDPVFAEGENLQLVPPGAPSETAITATRLAPLPAVDLVPLDYLVISRYQGDHVDATAADRIDKKTPVITTADADGIADCGFGDVHPLQWEQDVVQTKADEELRITAVPTHFPARGSTIQSNGYIIRYGKGTGSYTVYWTGDTRWFTDARAIKERLDNVNLMILNLGAVGAGSAEGMTTLNGKEAMQFVFMFIPKRLVPVSHSTFSHYTESVDDFKERIGLTMYERRLVILEEGGVFERDR